MQKRYYRRPAKLYRVNESEHFNLQSMHDKLMCQRYEAEENNDWDAYNAVTERIEEVESLLGKAPCIGARVDWPTLKRIREIRDERNMIRYSAALANGASERDAANAFM